MLRKHPWDNTYMRSLMKILTFAIRWIKDDKMGARGNFEKVQDRGSWYLVTLDGYIDY